MTSKENTQVKKNFFITNERENRDERERESKAKVGIG